MAVSAPDSASQIPGFRDRVGERMIVPQQSGALLEFLRFSEPLVQADFFGPTLKDRVARLSSFRHSAYCRVRRLQNVSEGEGWPALVSAHVAGQRLAEVLEVAARAELKPSTAGVLAATRQLMASVALLHDFAPDGFHGALGPERLILAGEGRVVIAEHVLGTLVKEAAAAWGVERLWQDFRIAALPDPGSPQWGRRVDVAQIGLTTVALLHGRPLSSSDYPSRLAQLLDQVEETTPEGTQVALRHPLRNWLERALALRSDAAFRSLLEAQKSFTQLLQEENYGASSVAWEAFVGVCETAALRVPVVVVAPETTVADSAPAAPPAGPVDLLPVTVVAGDQPGDDAPLAALLPAGPEPLAAEPEPATDAVARLREDPFGPWPVATPAGSAATLLDSFEVPPAKETAAAALAASTAATPTLEPTAVGWNAAVEPRKPEARETLFEAAPGVSAPPPPRTASPPPWEEPKSSPAAAAVDWGSRERARDLANSVLDSDQPPADDAETSAEFDQLERASRRDKRIRVAAIAALALVGMTLAFFAPYAWKVVFEGRLVQGTLSVDSDPPGAVISVDGQVRGHTPAVLAVRAGEHLLDVQVGGSAQSKKVTIVANRKTSERMTFAEAGERGGLMITTYPSKAKIVVDGVQRGEAPVKVTDLTPGTHTLLVETSFGSQEQDVVVQPGRVSQLSVPTASWIKVNAPLEFTVYEGSRLIGTVGPTQLMIAPGRHTLDFVSKSVGLRLRQYVEAAAGQVVTVPLDLPNGMMNLYSDVQAEVLLDGNPIGQTPLVNVSAPLGSHEIVFRHAKYGEVRYTVAVTLSAPIRLNVAFPRK